MVGLRTATMVLGMGNSIRVQPLLGQGRTGDLFFLRFLPYLSVLGLKGRGRYCFSASCSAYMTSPMAPTQLVWLALPKLEVLDVEIDLWVPIFARRLWQHSASRCIFLDLLSCRDLMQVLLLMHRCIVSRGLR